MIEQNDATNKNIVPLFLTMLPGKLLFVTEKCSNFKSFLYLSTTVL